MTQHTQNLKAMQQKPVDKKSTNEKEATEEWYTP